MKTKTISYTPPRMEFAEVTIEQGIANSVGTGGNEDFGKDTEQGWDN